MKLTPNARKILESVLLLIREGEKAARPVTQYEIVKSIFLADTSHLNEFGRPVTFDNYSALKFGPVPETTYNMLKGDFAWAAVGLTGAPWERRLLGGSVYNYVDAVRDADTKVLSRSDVAALRRGLEYVRANGFGGTRDETHKHPAYKQAWDSRGTKNAQRMDYSLLFDEPDPAGAQEIAYASAHS